MTIQRICILIAMSALILGPAWVGAQEPSGDDDRQDGAQDPIPDRQGDGRDRWGGEWRREYRGLRPWEEISDEKWAAVERFMKAHSPERLKRLDEVPDERREMIRRSIVRRFDSMQQAREREPKMYELRLKRMRIEDEIFTLGLKLKELVKPDAVEKTRKELRAQVKALLENRLSERRLRLEQAEQRLKEERKGLQREEEGLAEIVERHLKWLVEEDRWPGLGEPPPRAGPPLDDRARRFREMSGESRERPSEPAAAPAE